MTETKKQIKSKINDINQMLSELNVNKMLNEGEQTEGPIPSVELNVVNELHAIFN